MKRGLFIGRFQPFHLGHLYVIREILKMVDELIIGIGSAQLSYSLNNPFTAGERLYMIRDALIDEGIDIRRIWLIPISDINNNDLWVAYVVSHSPPFHIVFSNNPLVKILFSDAGFDIESVPLYNRKEYSATYIRELMVKGGNWEPLVPKRVAEIINEIGGVSRMKNLAKSDKFFR